MMISFRSGVSQALAGKIVGTPRFGQQQKQDVLTLDFGLRDSDRTQLYTTEDAGAKTLTIYVKPGEADPRKPAAILGDEPHLEAAYRQEYPGWQVLIKHFDEKPENAVIKAE